MTIHLTITSEYPSDFLAQLQQLATALSPQSPSGVITFKTSDIKVPDVMCVAPVAPEAEAMDMQAAGFTPTIKAEEAAEVVKVKKTRAKKVVAAEVVAVTEPVEVAPVEVAAPEPEIISQPEPEPQKLINRDDIRALMAKKGKDANGNDMPAEYAKFRTILKAYTPLGKEIKVISIPDDKLANVYYEMLAA